MKPIDQVRTWHQLQEHPGIWDIIVIGGGITGVGILREAARLDLKCLLLEQKDFSWGTSSRSSKMVHGGLRYIAQGDIKLTKHSVNERERLIREAPGLVQRLGYLFPIRKGQIPGKLLFNSLLKIYDKLAGKKPKSILIAENCWREYPGSTRRTSKGPATIPTPSQTIRAWY